MVGNNYIFGAKNAFTGWLFVVVGTIASVFGGYFAYREVFKPRRIGDVKYLSYKEE